MDRIASYFNVMRWPEWAEHELAGLPLKSLAVGLVVFTAVYLGLHALLKGASKVLPRLGRSEPVRARIRASLASVRRWTVVAVALFVSLQGFDLPARLDYVLKLACFATLTLQLLLVANIWIRFVFRDSPLVQGTHSQLRTMSGSLTTVAMVMCWTLGFLVLFDNFGFDVKTIIAGLGVGGLAIGLALQSVLGDIIASFTIGFDGPFEVGDFIIVNGLMGTVERVGLKTTRIRSLGGELLVFPNAKLVSSNIQNYKRMQQRRVVFDVTTTYDVPQEMLEDIPRILKDAVTTTEQTRFDRAHLANFADSGLRFEVVYYVLSADYNIYMDVQQEINFKIRREFVKRKIQFAFPTRTLELPEALQEALSKTTQQVGKASGNLPINSRQRNFG